jgi:hypothetical protein
VASVREAVDKYWQQQDEMNRKLMSIYGADLNTEGVREYLAPITRARARTRTQARTLTRPPTHTRTHTRHARRYHGPIKHAPAVDKSLLEKKLEIAQQRAAADWAAYNEAKTRSAEASERSDVRSATPAHVVLHVAWHTPARMPGVWCSSADVRSAGTACVPTARRSSVPGVVDACCDVVCPRLAYNA